MINESRMTDYIQSEVALTETQLFKISGWLLHWVHYVYFNVCITALFALNKINVNVPYQVQIVPAQSYVTIPS